MRYRRIAPGPSAARFVDHYWILEAAAEAADVTVQRVVPDGAPELILHLEAPFQSASPDGTWQDQPRCFVAGQLTAPLLLRPSGAARILGVRFHPHGLSDILRESVQRLTNSLHPIDSPAFESIPQLEHWLLARAGRCPDPVVGEAVRQIAAARGNRDIASLARDLHISTRHLERRFLHRTGLPPKLYARMRRFQSVFPAIESGDDWPSAALRCGYYDQAHLIRDFRQFAGDPPAALLAAGDLASHFLSHFSKTSTAHLG
jgi:AraC-like DNA-binding protein